MYEVVLRASLPEDAMAIYVADSAAHPDEPYFLINVEQDELTVPALQIGQRNDFLSEVYRGISPNATAHEWPWKCMQPLIKDVQVTIDRVVAYRHFDLNLEYPKSLTYLLYGSASEAHLCHLQTSEPDFDQVVILGHAPSWLPTEKLEAGVHINFPGLPSHPPYCSSPLINSTDYGVQYQGAGPLRKISVDRSIWFSTKITNHDDPCS